MCLRSFVRTILFVLLAAGGFSSPAAAQFEEFQVLTCYDFQRTGDGSWTPTHIVRVGKWLITPGIILRPGNILSGIDIGAALERSCARGGSFLDWH
jgi:hypothetical protein